jgi:5-methyltetrahydrofolate--homocysteine methyltransferase
MPSTTRGSRYLAALAERTLVYDGAMGTSIDTFNLTAADYGGEATHGNRDYLVLTRPDVIEQIHRSFMDAGADVLETDTFQATRLRLAEWGLADQTAALNQAAARLARRIADDYQARDSRPRFVAGSLGPTGKLPSSDDPALSDITFAELSDIFREQAMALIEGGVDVLLIETSVDILEVKAALDGVRRAKADLNRPDIAVQAQVFLDLSGKMLLGTEVPALIATLEALAVDVIGLNCSTGPEHMREGIRTLCQHSRLPISCIPNAGLPLEVDGETVYPMEPAPFAEILADYISQYGIAVVGGCCGTRPEHIRQLRAAVDGVARAQRPIEYLPSVSSAVRAVALRQDLTLLMIGERVNTLGSRKVKRLLLDDDYDGVVDVAREQMESGAHALDVCVAMTERADERDMMSRLVKKLSMAVETPLVIDTTEADVLQAALELYPGRAIVNSVSLEGGRGDKIDRTLPLVARYGAATVAMTIDEEGMAHTAERKLAIAQRLAQIAADEYGVPAEALVFDVLTFPITTGQQELRRAAVETLDGIRLVKQHIPGCFTTLGVSNLSFGVKPHARAALNSVFLKHAADAGLDSAIINPAHVTPYADIPAEQIMICEDLIFDRREDALARFIAFYEETAAAEAVTRADPTEGMSVAERLHWKVVHRRRDGVEEDIDLLLETGLEARGLRTHDAEAAHKDPVTQASPRGEVAVGVLNDVLLPAMKEVGDLFGAGQLILPFVLQSAEVMKRAVGHLEGYLDKLDGASKGRIVLATVYGDVHDIGKNLVNTILANNGYTVYDLGKQVPINTIIEKAIEVDADAIGLSALLVSTSKQMPLCVQELHRRGLGFPVVIGGAAINRAFGRRASLVAPEQPYDAGVFYCRDAFEGLETVDRLTGDPAARLSFVEQIHREALAEAGRPVAVAANPGRRIPRSAVRTDVDLPTPPFWGARTLLDVPLERVFRYLDLKTLFRLHWGGKVHGDEFDRLVEQEFRPRLERMKAQAIAEGWLMPRVVYGYFPAHAEDETLVIADAGAPGVEVGRMTFPRQPDRERLCLADYFRPRASGERDVVALQVVTVGERADELVAAAQQAGEYAEAYFLHGLAVQSAEALAEVAHRHILRELGLPTTRGKRYSWGYPACPDLDQHALVWRLLPVEDAIGVSLTESYQLVPEQSTAALVVHHPEAKYYSTHPIAAGAVAD